MKGSHFILKSLLNELNEIDGIAAYSLFQMPFIDEDRVKIFNEVISKEPYMQNNIALDTDQTLFYVTSIEHFAVNKDISELEMKNGKLYNKSATNNHPDKPISVLHLAANINGDKYLEHVGYNLENNKVNPPGKYKIKQVMEYVRYILYKNSKPVLIANCSFIAIFIIGMIVYIIHKYMINK